MMNVGRNLDQIQSRSFLINILVTTIFLFLFIPSVEWFATESQICFQLLGESCILCLKIPGSMKIVFTCTITHKKIPDHQKKTILQFLTKNEL